MPGKSNKNTKTETTVAPATVPEQTAVALAQTPAPVKGGAKGKKQATTAAPAAPTTPVTAQETPEVKAAPTKKAAAKKTEAPAAPAKKAPVKQAAEKKTPAKAAAKKTPAKQTAGKKAAPAKKAENESEHEPEQNANGKRIRSFKVQLPGAQNYSGRFTGLTPYQAANKALSKYFRETENPEKNVMFTIIESTRGSKRNTYSYKGRREKLTNPVEYPIKDGTTIVKYFKNHLEKVKRAENKEVTL